MNTVKRIENMRERNLKLDKEVKDLRNALELLKNESAELDKEKLLKDLESIKEEWNQSLQNLKKYELDYSSLILELKDMTKGMRDFGVRFPWYKRLFFKIRKIFIHND